MDDAQHEHPDEGTIHAWLDGALDDETSASLAAHVESCGECAERVAEARGLIAGASRIVAALDDVRTIAGPAWGQAPVAAPAAPRAGAGSAWRLLRVTPARAAIAATVLVALGVSLTYKRAAVDSEAPRATSQATEMAAREPAAPSLQPHDALLDSAVARNLAAVQPPRVLKAAPGPDLPVPEPAPGGAVLADRAAPARVAAARAEMQAQRDSGSGVAADALSSRAPAAANRANEPTFAAAVRADSVARASAGSVVAAAPTAPTAAPTAQTRMRVVAPPGECYRVESASGAAAAWGPVALPFVVRVDSASSGARVLTVAGQPTEASAVVTRGGGDSLLFRLRRLGFDGTLALGAPGDARAGVMRSRPSDLQLSEMVVTAVPSAADARERRAIAGGRAKAAPAPQAKAAEEQSAASAAPAVPVVARRLACP